MKTARLFSKNMTLLIDGYTSQKLVTAIALKRNDVFFTKHCPEDIANFAKAKMTKSGFFALTILMDVILSVIGLEKNLQTACRILSIREDLYGKGGRQLGFATELRHKMPDRKHPVTETTYNQGGAQCLLLYKGEMVIATSRFDPFGFVVRKKRLPVTDKILRSYLGTRNSAGERSALAT